MPADGGTLSAKSTVQSLSKGLRVLEAFTAERSEMGLAEVARAAGIDNGTAFRFLNTLVMLGYIRKTEAKRFRLTLKCLDLGFRAFPYREYSEVFFGTDYYVLRGGSWATHPRVATTTFRNWDLPQRRQIFAGVRLARDPEGSPR